MNADEALRHLKAPADPRPGWLVLQVMITRACTERCFHCTQGSNLAGKHAMMTVDEFETAVKSLKGFPGTIGVFGGTPTLHKDFPKICEVMRAHVPYMNRGLWTNTLNGHGAICRVTFRPDRSNINVHLDRAAFEEVARDWPEAIATRRQHVEHGRDIDSLHSAPFVAIKDVVADESKMWDMIADCDIARNWSACIGTIPGRGLRAYWCELAYAQAALHCDDPDWPDLGMLPTEGWWRQSMGAFAQQVKHHCPSCGIALRRPGQKAIHGQVEEFSETHRSIARPKDRDRPVQFVQLQDIGARPNRPSTEYLSGVTPGYKGD